MTTSIWTVMFGWLRRPAQAEKTGKPDVVPRRQGEIGTPQEESVLEVLADNIPAYGDAPSAEPEASADEIEPPDKPAAELDEAPGRLEEFREVETTELDVAARPGNSRKTADQAWRLELQRQRAEARATALSGPQRISLNESAGPGSLAEALNELVREGKVVAQFVEDETDGAHIAYRPV